MLPRNLLDSKRLPGGFSKKISHFASECEKTATFAEELNPVNHEDLSSTWAAISDWWGLMFVAWWILFEFFRDEFPVSVSEFPNNKQAKFV